jgi:hypothetical protein
MANLQNITMRKVLRVALNEATMNTKAQLFFLSYIHWTQIQ